MQSACGGDCIVSTQVTLSSLYVVTPCQLAWISEEATTSPVVLHFALLKVPSVVFSGETAKILLVTGLRSGSLKASRLNNRTLYNYIISARKYLSLNLTPSNDEAHRNKGFREFTEES
jgi:hypothetical protein